MPPVFGPASPASRRLWSCTGSMVSVPLTVGEREQRKLLALHELLDEDLASRVAERSVAQHVVDRARGPARCVSHTMTPLPAASPVALMTTGAPSSATARRAVSTSVWCDARAVGTPASSHQRPSRIASTSRCARRRAEGPNVGDPARARSASTSPAASGASGPTTTRSTRSASASVDDARHVGRSARARNARAPRCPGCPVQRGARELGRHASASRRGRARDRPRRRSVPSHAAFTSQTS